MNGEQWNEQLPGFAVKSGDTYPFASEFVLMKIFTAQ
jgi:hypothetical protein